MSKIPTFEFDIEYVKGKNNVVADALFRRPSISLMDATENWKAILEVEYAKDKFYCEFFDGNNHDDMYKVLEGIIYYKHRIYLVPGLSLKDNFLSKSHESLVATHPGFFKTYRVLRERFSWKGLKGDNMKYANECSTCQQKKVEHTYPSSLLHPFPIPEQKRESISLDSITGLPNVLGKDCIFVVVDRLTKFSHFFVITTSFNSSQVAELFFREFFQITWAS